jgi:hypothetical protein
MNCTEIREHIADLFDDTISAEKKDEFFAHFRECSNCKRLYEEVSVTVETLKPRLAITANDDLHTKIIDRLLAYRELKQTRKVRILPHVSRGWKKVIAIAAVLMGLFLIIPVLNFFSRSEVKASTSILYNSINAMEKIQSFYMEFNVRTLPVDNFEYISRDETFVSHKLWKVAGNPGKWRVEKPGRTVVMDGKHQYLYVGDPVGISLVAGPDAGFVEWMRNLLNPEDILEKERINSLKNGDKFKIEEKDNIITMTINAKALGDFSNAYLLNTSIPESNNSRIYTFDKTTHLLKSLDIYIDSAGKSIKIFEVKEIRYNMFVENAIFSIQLPAGQKWVPENELMKNSGVAGVTSDEVARQFFNACHSEDWPTVRKLIPGFMNFLQYQFAVKTEYGGLTVISIGKPFKSGRYPGEFVPYEIRKRNGAVKKWNLALRNDNAEKKWVLDGGF